ncbi:Cysteine protease xcp1 [Thalictrum thalictroides]|uniref:Cysteine protease xcp1 n=1 Tax=Thalictrum thalictroides TaxID=46969 RepID=A0A7J6WCI6_THATH|nr:Cysteine protease xcp1 [Thalictrum thalictroides]
MSVLVCSSLADHDDFSIVGYAPEDLSCIDKLITLFESWMSKHGKSYQSFEEKLHRFELFKENLKHIDETNKKVTSYWLGLNEFADMSHEEFKSKYLGLKGKYIVSSGGLHKEDDYPYLMEEGTCEEKKEETQVVTITGYEDVPKNDEASLIKALSQQPLSVAIEASGRDFQFYSGGVFNGNCGTELDHGVAAVGYGSLKGMDYIIVKNSWGPKWGEKGYIRMKRNTGKPEGLCGINSLASYPTKNK